MIFLSLIRQYDIHVTRLCKEIQSLSTNPTWNAKFVLKAIKGLWEFKLIAQNLFQELRRMNVYTIDGPTDYVFVRTYTDVTYILQTSYLSIGLTDFFRTQRLLSTR